MKKLGLGLFILIIAFTLAGCTPGGDPSEDSTTATVVAVLIDAGYVMTEHDNDAKTYFQNNTVSDLGLDLVVTDLYIGYLDGGSWAQVVGFENSAAAESFKTALQESDAALLVYVDGNTVMQTYTQETFDLY
jgi:hypothetical protein